MSIDLKKIPSTTGIYKFFNKTEIIYIGKAKNLKKRVSSYFTNSTKDRKTSQIKKLTDQIETFTTNNEVEALLLEQSLIKENKPKFNILLRDDKTYPYIYFSDNHDFPLIGLKRTKKAIDHRYYGPYISSNSVKHSIKEIQKIFKIRNCSDSTFSSRSRPCIEYQMNKCSAPCVGNISKNQYAEDIIDAKDFLQTSHNKIEEKLKKKIDRCIKKLDFENAAIIRDKINKINVLKEEQSISIKTKDIDIFSVEKDNGYFGISIVAVRKGKIRGTKTYLIKKGVVESLDSIYERAIFSFYNSGHDLTNTILTAHKISSNIVLKEAIKKKFDFDLKVISTPRKEIKPILNLCKSNAKQIISNHLTSEEKYKFAFNDLKSKLNMKKLEKIESFDISHLNSDNCIASCVVFNIKGKIKNDYRLFNIPKEIAGNDTGSLQHAISRRLKYYDNHDIKPDLLLIDGGINQLNFSNNLINNSLHSDVKVISIAKGLKRIRATDTVHSSEGIVELNKNSKAYLLLQEIRDEAHRFAIIAQRKKNKNSFKKSFLDGINGVGPVLKKRLFKKFKNSENIKSASIQEIMTIAGINEKIAKKIIKSI